MSELCYTPLINDNPNKTYEERFLSSCSYRPNSFYANKGIMDEFRRLKALLVDMDRARIKRIVNSNEQEYIILMNAAREKLLSRNVSSAYMDIVLKLFKECVFEYYMLTPLIEDEEISDIDVNTWDHITCKKKGKRYVTDVTFLSENDYEQWYQRLMTIHRRKDDERHPLQSFMDLKATEDYRLRIDLTLKYATATGHNRLHIRKFPKIKPTWEKLFADKMLTPEMLAFIKDRIAAGCSFILSGYSGSGKSTLLNMMIDLIPYSNKVLVAQETDELYSETHPQMIFEHVVTSDNELEQPPASLEDILRLGLLQDINTFAIGEIKGAEALHCFITAMNTGASFFGTLHANDAYSSLYRLAFCAKLGSDYSVQMLHEMLAGTPIVLIHMSYYSIDEIVEVNGWDYEKQMLKHKTVYKKNCRKVA